MSWLTTWPEQGIPQYAAHATERQAEAHACEVVKSGRASVATAFWSEGTAEIKENVA